MAMVAGNMRPPTPRYYETTGVGRTLCAVIFQCSGDRFSVSLPISIVVTVR